MTKVARKWKAKLSYGPGCSTDRPAWSKTDEWIEPVTRRIMRERVSTALANSTLERIEVWRVDK